MRFVEFLQDQSYREGPESTVTHDGIEYQLDRILELSRSLPVTNFPISYLTWMIDGVKLTADDKKRVSAVNLSFPIIVTPWNDKYVIIDGWHRVVRAVQEGCTTIPARVIFSDILALSTNDYL